MDSEQLPARTSGENPDAVALRGYVEVALAIFNSARDALESVELGVQGLSIRAEDSVPLTSANEALRRLELLMDSSRVDMINAQNNYATFVTSERGNPARQLRPATGSQGKGACYGARCDLGQSQEREEDSARAGGGLYG